MCCSDLSCWCVGKLPSFTLTLLVSVLETSGRDARQITGWISFGDRKCWQHIFLHSWGFWNMMSRAGRGSRRAEARITLCDRRCLIKVAESKCDWLTLCTCLMWRPSSQLIMCEELLLVETNHQQALLMEVAVVMGGEELLCVCVCARVTLHLYPHPGPHFPEHTLESAALTKTGLRRVCLTCCLCWPHEACICSALSRLLLKHRTRRLL